MYLIFILWNRQGKNIIRCLFIDANPIFDLKELKNVYSNINSWLKCIWIHNKLLPKSKQYLPISRSLINAIFNIYESLIIIKDIKDRMLCIWSIFQFLVHNFEVVFELHLCAPREYLFYYVGNSFYTYYHWLYYIL